jgi:hypothetical protein
MLKINILVHFGEKEKDKLFKKCLDQLFEQAVMVNSHTFTSHAKIHIRYFDNMYEIPAWHKTKTESQAMTLCFYKSQQSLESDGQATLSYHTNGNARS